MTTIVWVLDFFFSWTSVLRTVYMVEVISGLEATNEKYYVDTIYLLWKVLLLPAYI